MNSVVTQLKKISWDKPGVINLEISNTMLYSKLKDDFQPDPKEFTPFQAMAVGRSVVRDGNILKKYSGYVSRDKVRFNRYLPSASGEDGSPNPKPKKNPWYGTRSYFVPSVELTLERPRESRISFDLIKGVGHLDSPPRSGFNFIDKCSWIIVKNSYTKKSGKCAELKTWKSGGRSGWTDAVYDSKFNFGPPNAVKDVKVGMREYKEAKGKEGSFQNAVK